MQRQLSLINADIMLVNRRGGGVGGARGCCVQKRNMAGAYVGVYNNNYVCNILDRFREKVPNAFYLFIYFVVDILEV